MEKLSTIFRNFPDLYESYKKWVSSNPHLVGEVETTVKWVSYFIAGRINSSAAISELIYSLSNLIVLFNDRILAKTKTSVITSTTEYKLKLLLTTLEYCEVFIEVSAKKLWGDKGRWFFITVVQVVKCIGRLLLTLEYKETIIQSPPIIPLNRKKIDKNNDEQFSEDNSTDVIEQYNGFKNSFTFKLKRSGKILRKVEGAPPIHLRNWKPINDECKLMQQQERKNYQQRTYQQNENYKILSSAETLYIFKPLLHLTSIRAFGVSSWKSYCLALIVDFASLRMYHQHRALLSKKQKVELSKRCVALLLYLLRSPFYDKFSKNKIEFIINGISNNVSLTKAICKPILQYIPQWQNTYFYMWST